MGSVMTAMGIRMAATHNLEDAEDGVSEGLSMSDRWDEFSDLDARRHGHRRSSRRGRGGRARQGARARGRSVAQSEEQKLYRQASRRAAVKLSFVTHLVTYGAVVVMLLFIAGFRAAFYTAFETGDADGIEALFVEDPPEGGFPLDELVRISAWNAGQGSTITDRACTESGSDPTGIVVVCQFELHQAVQDVAGAPGTVFHQTITVSAEGIQTVDSTWADPGFQGEGAFGAWLLANHFEDADAADWDEGGSIEDARSAGEIQRQYAEQWAAYLEESGCTYDATGC